VRLEQTVPASAAHRGHGLTQWWLDRSVRAKGLIVVAIPLAALVGTVTVNLALLSSERQERALGLAATTLTSAATQDLADAVNAETGVRGYAATSDPLFLDPYNLALSRIAADRKALRAAAVAVGDTGQQQALDATTVKEFGELISIRNAIAHGTTGPALLPALEAGKATMDLLRRQVSALMAAPQQQAQNRRNEISTLESAIEALNYTGLALGVLAGIAGTALFASGISTRLSAATGNARRLGHGQPLEPVRASRDELGRVADSHVQASDLLTRREQELTAARDEALHATQVKSAFLSRTSHELRTPLNSVLGFAQLLQLSDLAQDDRDSAERILEAGRHLLALINELIDIARIESGQLSLSVEPVPVASLIREVTRLTAPLAAERSIQIVTQFPDPVVRARADRQRFLQIVLNLVSNAIKYNRRGGGITITCRAEDPDEVAVTVADTGPGIPEDSLERIFAPFERLGAEQTEVEGTGIGLPLARALAEAMGGKLTVTSVLGQGSQFELLLPRAPADPATGPDPSAEEDPIAEQPASSGPAGAVFSILYIEDNTTNVDVISRFLKSRPGATLEAVASGHLGIERAKRDLPDIVLLDLHLADIPGEQVLDELRADPRTAGIPVVVLSADATPGQVRRLIDRGALSYLTKPLDLGQLGELLDSRAAASDHGASSGRPAGP
jgi:signal transduction histidine kinase/ActR/RegA family two-component response regulator